MQPSFPFPFEPYDIQTKFMKELYFTIENKKLGIFESPTGTVILFCLVISSKIKKNPYPLKLFCIVGEIFKYLLQCTSMVKR